jgi:hypothetical protein
MTRLEIRTLVRTLIDQPDEYPDGTFTNIQLNTLINLAKDKVVLALASFVPWKFNKSTTVDVTAGTASYTLTTDWSITDAVAVVDIIRNKTGEDRTPVLFAPNTEDLALFSNLSNMDSVLWGQVEDGKVEFSPPCLATVTDRYRVIYVKKVPDLNHDTLDTPSPNVATPDFDSQAHPLIAYYAAALAMIPDEKSSAEMMARYQELVYEIAWNLSSQPGARYNVLLPSRAIFNAGMLR